MFFPVVPVSCFCLLIHFVTILMKDHHSHSRLPAAFKPAKSPVCRLLFISWSLRTALRALFPRWCWVCFNYVHLTLLISLNHTGGRTVRMTSAETSVLAAPRDYERLTLASVSSSWAVWKRSGAIILLSAFPGCTWPKYRIGCPNNYSSVSSKL